MFKNFIVYLLLGKNESRFSFANSKSSFDDCKKLEEGTKTDMRKSMQEFLKFSLSPGFSPKTVPKNFEMNGIFFENFINPMFLFNNIYVKLFLNYRTYLENKAFNLDDQEADPKKIENDQKSTKKNINENLKTTYNNNIENKIKN